MLSPGLFISKLLYLRLDSFVCFIFNYKCFGSISSFLVSNISFTLGFVYLGL